MGRRRNKIGPNELVRLYVFEQLSQRQAAARLGVAIDTLKRELTRLGIPLRHPGSGTFGMHIEIRRTGTGFGAFLRT
jgi:hypothetical protein